MSLESDTKKIFDRLRKHAAKRLSLSLDSLGSMAPADSRPVDALLAKQNRPKRGLSPEQALRAYSDPADLAVVDGYSDATVPCAGAPGVEPPPKVIPHRAWKAAREKIEEAQLERLRAGTLAASAFPEDGDRREVLDTSLFDLFWIDYEFEEIVGEGRSYKTPEIFLPMAIPLNIRYVPEWLLPPPSIFEPEPDYRHVTLRGESLVLGVKQAKIIEALHQASVTDNPWRTGRDLLDLASSKSEHVREAMKGKMVLIDSDGHGHYRLNIFS